MASMIAMACAAPLEVSADVRKAGAATSYVPESIMHLRGVSRANGSEQPNKSQVDNSSDEWEEDACAEAEWEAKKESWRKAFGGIGSSLSPGSSYISKTPKVSMIDRFMTDTDPADF
ncbi:hypothetical protein DSO57_1024149 [Entomophthora muscae]|uniref:Uncharacterized protein n=1 Tax=Entomophthora muscae TaxID=34485 RepID=A0ACC2UC57_9FUNG|nr:hypothetical protein DSO57_1024149 [Entomophthora muscae]